MKNSRIQMKTNKKKRFKRNIFMFITTIFLVIGGVAAYFIYETVRAANEAYTEMDRGNKSKLREYEITMGKDPFSVLILGIEDYSSGGANGRTDSMMVATLNPDTQSMKLLSIPRDTRVYFPTLDRYSKINHANAYGGKDMTIDRVEELLGIPIDYVVSVNFEGFKNIIDIIGGVTVEVPFNFSEKSDESKKMIYFTEGEMNLDGEEALAYARMRKQDPRGDHGRSARQRQIMMAAVDQLIAPQNLLKIDRISRELGQNIETNIRITDGLGLTRVYTDFDSNNIESLAIKGSDEYIGGISYFVPTEEGIAEVQSILKSHLGMNSLTTGKNDTLESTTSEAENQVNTP